VQFLDEIFDGDEELIEFVRLVIGYALTGLTKEQCFFVLYGTGANGKSTFINVLSHILGAYAQNTPFNTFEHGKETSTGNDLAKLNGARYVFTSEVNEGSRFNAQRVKALTGSDEISCRFLYKELFTYRPKFKVFMAVNHKPTVRDDSEGFWRRVRLIPFTQSFMGNNADNRLEEKLLSESESILAWCVEASIDYLKHGLTMPQAVMVATSAYRNENDILGLFLEDKCTQGANVQCKSKALYEAYSTFAEENGLHPFSNVKFSQAMEKRGLRKERQMSGIVWCGVGLLADEAQS
jgi:putative DNA primase/helicase